MFDAVDLTRLPPPDVVEALDYEAILADALAHLRTIWPEFDALLESEPAVKQTELVAYLALNLRQRVNDGARAVMLAFATGADLDHIAAMFGVERLVVVPADPETIPPTEAVLESDDRLRRRAQLSPEAGTAAGTIGRYTFYALTSSGRVADAVVTSPAPGDVLISVLCADDDLWIPDAPLLAIVDGVVQDEDVRCLNDTVTVAASGVEDYAIEATLTFLPGASQELALAAASANAERIRVRRQMDRNVSRSEIFGALHVEGVQNVLLISPAADIVIPRTSAARCTGVTLLSGGVDV